MLCFALLSVALVLAATHVHHNSRHDDLLFDYQRLRDRSVSKYINNNDASKETLATMLGFFGKPSKRS